MRKDIPPLFGLEFNTGLWQAGHVCPKDIADQILLVTLNRQGVIAFQRYLDYFKVGKIFTGKAKIVRRSRAKRERQYATT